jgi:conjugative transfer signal peptidase TraF
MSRRTGPRVARALDDWGTELRQRREKRRRTAFRAALVAIGCGAVTATIVVRPVPRLIWNASASAPIGLYAVSPAGRVHVGDTVIAWPPRDVRALAAARHYLPSGVPLVKRVAAGPGHRICGLAGTITVDGMVAAKRHAVDPAGRAMPWWRGCHWLGDDQYLLLMANVPTSFDGRYFGMTKGADIVGPARLLWRR